MGVLQRKQRLNDQGPDGGLTFLIGELYEIVEEAKTTLQWITPHNDGVA